MINIKETCIQFLKNKDIQNDINEIFSCITDKIYEDMQNYIWIICIYTIFLIILILANSIVLLRLYYHIIFLESKLVG